MRYRGAIAIAVAAMVFARSRETRAIPPIDVWTVNCRDGGGAATITHVVEELDLREKNFVRRYQLPTCDLDLTCDGICTFAPARGGPNLRVPVGSRTIDTGPLLEFETYVYRCKAGVPARCRILKNDGYPSPPP